MFKRLYEMFFSDKEMWVYGCNSCGRLRTEFEWKIKKERACVCGSTKVIGANPNKMGKFWLKTRYVLKGY